MKMKMTYEDAFLELQEITKNIENENVSIDILATQVKRASELISICKAKLHTTEIEVAKIIAQIEKFD